jgi:hypothetical protein
MKSVKYSINVRWLLFITTQHNYLIKSYQYLNCILKVKITRKSTLHITLLCNRSITPLYSAFLATRTDDNAHAYACDNGRSSH